MNIYKQRRNNLLENSKAEIIVIAANKPMQSSLDQSYDFIQESNFYYLTGLDNPGLILVITKNKTFLVLPKLSDYQKVFDGEVDRASLKVAGVDKISNFEEGDEELSNLLTKSKTVHLLFDESDKLSIYGIAALPFRKDLIQSIRRINRNIELVDIQKNIAGLRMIKDKTEVDFIKEAVRITKFSIEKAMRRISTGKINHTQDLADYLLSVMKRSSADGWAFKPVISLNEASTIIHYVDLNQEIKPGDLILVDVGCKYKSYCSDISRSFVYGDPNERQNSLLKSVKKVQKQLIDELKPGITYSELEERTEELIYQELVYLNLLKENNRDNLRDFYPHSVSHHLGLDTHDLAIYKEPLKEGMVVTIEPGIYVKKWKLGVRFEDDVLITKDGAMVL